MACYVASASRMHGHVPSCTELLAQPHSFPQTHPPRDHLRQAEDQAPPSVPTPPAPRRRGTQVVHLQLLASPHAPPTTRSLRQRLPDEASAPKHQHCQSVFRSASRSRHALANPPCPLVRRDPPSRPLRRGRPSSAAPKPAH